MPRTQEIELKFQGRKIVIDTPAGFVTIERSDKYRLFITCPDGITAHRNEEIAASASRYVRKVKDKYAPKYRLAAPVVDAEGYITGVSLPSMFSLGSTGDHNGTNPRPTENGAAHLEGRHDR